MANFSPFQQSNSVLSDNTTLIPVLKDNNKVTACIELSFKERLKLLIFGKFYLSLSEKNKYILYDIEIEN